MSDLIAFVFLKENREFIGTFQKPGIKRLTSQYKGFWCDTDAISNVLP